MPTLDAKEYESFSYDEATPSMTLDEAIKKASELRKNDSESFFRVESSNNGNSFHVKKISVSEVYADFIARSVRTLSRFVRVSRKA